MSKFAVVDVETSGLEPKKHHVLQVGVVVTDGHLRLVPGGRISVKGGNASKVTP